MRVPVLSNGILGLGNDPGWGREAPLWFYILKEAELPPYKAERLGPVGGRIVAEVLVGLLQRDPNSYLYLNAAWKPTPPIAPDDGPVRVRRPLEVRGSCVARRGRLDQRAGADRRSPWGWYSLRDATAGAHLRRGPRPGPPRPGRGEGRGDGQRAPGAGDRSDVLRHARPSTGRGLGDGASPDRRPRSWLAPRAADRRGPGRHARAAHRPGTGRAHGAAKVSYDAGGPGR